MASSKNKLVEKQLREGIIAKILSKIIMGRTDKALKLFADDPKLVKSIKQIDRQKKILAKGLEKYPGLKKQFGHNL